MVPQIHDELKSGASGESSDREEGRKDWQSLVEEQIRLAQERGAFDDLPGKGKPLNLERNPYVAEEMELAYNVLQDAGFAPEWIELDKAIRRRLATARATLQRGLAWHRGRLEDLADRADARAQVERERAHVRRQQAICTFEEEVGAINRDIRDLNLKIPISRLQRVPVDVAREIERAEVEETQDGAR